MPCAICLISTPSSPQRKSKCHQARRNSPSVASFSPHSSCLVTIFAISASSIAVSSAAVIAPFSRFARACLIGAVRRKLPTWSARNGGLVRCIDFVSPFLKANSIRPLAPHFLRHFDDSSQLRPLLILAQRIAFLGRGEAALTRQAE